MLFDEEDDKLRNPIDRTTIAYAELPEYLTAGKIIKFEKHLVEVCTPDEPDTDIALVVLNQTKDLVDELKKNRPPPPPKPAAPAQQTPAVMPVKRKLWRPPGAPVGHFTPPTQTPAPAPSPTDDASAFYPPSALQSFNSSLSQHTSAQTGSIRSSDVFRIAAPPPVKRHRPDTMTTHRSISDLYQQSAAEDQSGEHTSDSSYIQQPSDESLHNESVDEDGDWWNAPELEQQTVASQRQQLPSSSSTSAPRKSAFFQSAPRTSLPTQRLPLAPPQTTSMSKFSITSLMTNAEPPRDIDRGLDDHGLSEAFF